MCVACYADKNRWRDIGRNHILEIIPPHTTQTQHTTQTTHKQFKSKSSSNILPPTNTQTHKKLKTPIKQQIPKHSHTHNTHHTQTHTTNENTGCPGKFQKIAPAAHTSITELGSRYPAPGLDPSSPPKASHSQEGAGGRN